MDKSLNAPGNRNSHSKHKDLSMLGLTKYAVDESFIKCQICRERFSRPKLLKCLHTFCEHCLTVHIQHMAKKKKVDDQLCGSCEEGGDATFASYWCRNCAEPLCDNCLKHHRLMKISRRHKIEEMDTIKRHPKRILTELVVYVMERPQMGAAKRISALDFYKALMDPKVKPKLSSMLNISDITHKVMMKDQLKQYLDNPPAGLNRLLWQQGILDNPDPEKLIPVPMMGFKELHKRLKIQEHHTKLHQQRLDLISGEVTEFQNKQGNMLAKLEEYKRKYLELSHRVLQVIVKQEVYRKQGFAIQADEEQLRVQLETLQAELNHPTQFKGRLNELMSQIRMQNHLSSSRADVNYQMDPLMQQEIKQLLKQQQDGLTHLIDITKEDMQDLNLIEQGLTDTSTGSRR